MSVILFVSAVFLGFVAAAGFLFGQLFSGDFSMGSTLAGVGGLVCAAFALRMAKHPGRPSAGVYVACATALLGVAMDTARHYMYLDIPGSYYAWPIIGAFAACVVALAGVARWRRASSSHDGS